MVEENANQKSVTCEVPPPDQGKEDAVRSRIFWICPRFPSAWHPQAML